MRQIHNTSVCVLGVPPLSLLFHCEATLLHSLCSSQDPTPLVRHLCCTRPPPAPQGSISDCLGIVGSLASWTIVTQGIFQLSEINQMEREMCQYLEWELNVDPVTLREFEDTRSPSRHHRNPVFLAPHPFMIHSPAPISPSHRTRRHHPHRRRHHPKRP
ncbi:hypothetical protein J3R83DRAFT_12678 [Lanmaoa asiatica]|nr:hypothetical protein J3R83DRAFT_12678 [Lanmaoa asiatica]